MSRDRSLERQIAEAKYCGRASSRDRDSQIVVDRATAESVRNVEPVFLIRNPALHQACRSTISSDDKRGAQ